VAVGMALDIDSQGESDDRPISCTLMKNQSIEFAVEPYTIWPGVRIAYVQAPENVRVELVERT
jgi:hypothetical protein